MITDEWLQILTYTLMTIERFFNVPRLLCHGQILFNGHLRGPVKLSPVAERFAVWMSLPVLKTKVCPDRKSKPDLLHRNNQVLIIGK